MTEFSVRAEAAAAVRCVAAAYDRLPESSRPEVRWSEVGRGKWQAIRLDIGSSKEEPMSKEPAGAVWGTK